MIYCFCLTGECFMKVKDMTKGNELKLIILFSLPLMLGNIFQQLYTVCDTIIVSRHLGVKALAAIGCSDWLTWMGIAVIQFKVESQIIAKHPEWKMNDRCLFEHVDYQNGTIDLQGKTYKMSSCSFPTINPAAPSELSPEEEILISKLHHSFSVCEKLHKHIRVMLQHGCMYGIYNNNLLFHASCPLNEDGSLKEVEIYPGKKYSGRALMHHTGMQIRTAFQQDSAPEERDYAIDYFLYLWCGPDSPLFDKSKMATFERYFIADKETHVEEKGYYFKLRDNEEVIDHILDAFGVVGSNRHIINGHVPVRTLKGENPIKANGKLMVIDGGFSKAYHNETGIAGYTLVYHSRGFQLVQHEPFTSTEDAIQRGTDIKSTTQIVEMSNRRMLVADTDIGVELRKQIEDLEELLYAYRHGYIKEKEKKEERMTGNEIGDEGAKAMSEMLKVNSTLTTLNLFSEEERKEREEKEKKEE